MSSLLSLPGVVVDGDSGISDPREDWPLIESSVREALKKFREFRVVEGDSMEKDLQQNLRIITTELEKIAARAPQIVRDFRDKLRDRVAELLRDGEATVEPANLIREVSIYAERCDISEEILRLRSHLDQFQSFIRQEQSAGRKLDFLTQEMVREVNTIGSKANNAEVAHSVVEIKAAVETHARSAAKCGIVRQANPERDRAAWLELDGQKQTHRIVVLSGPSGSGKSTIVNRLVAPHRSNS